MKRTVSFLTLLIFLISACSCEAKLPEQEIPSSSGSKTAPSETSTSSSEPTPETTLSYVHGEDGYYSALDSGVTVKVRDQVNPGACGAFACAEAIERNINMFLNGNIEIDPKDLILESMAKEKTEGVIITDRGFYDIAPSGPFDIEWATADGFMGYTLTAAPYLFEIKDETPVSLSPEIAKKAIRTYGGATAYIGIRTPEAMGWNGPYFTYLNRNGMDHVVNIIGYDDHFPKELFDIEASQDGAWLAQNSMGEEWGDSGYFWISYDSNVVFIDAFGFSDRYSEVLSYSAGVHEHFSTEGKTVIGNKYEYKGKIGGIGTYVGILGRGSSPEPCSATVKITDENFDQVLMTKEQTFPTGGYYVIDLDEPLEIDGRFGVVIEYGEKDEVQVEGESDEFFYGNRAKYVTSINEGESYVLLDGNWLDLSDIKTSEALGIDFEPRNPYVNILFVD